MKKGMFFVIVFISIVLLLHLSLADFSYKSNTIQTKYQGGEALKGKINISFTAESAQSLLSSNYPGNITLINFLNANSLLENQDFNCSIKNCISGYKVKDSISSPLTFNSQERKIVGFKIIGNNVEVKAAKFDITSDISDSCPRQLSLEILEENNYSLQNYNYKPVSCGVEYAGCFNTGLSSQDYQLAEITSTPYCEKINLPPAPAYLLAANIKNTTQSSAPLKMSLYDYNWNSLADCNLPSHSQQTQKLTCIVNYTGTSTKDHFVCVSLQSGAGTGSNYQIKSEQSGALCGTSDVGPYAFTRDYDIAVELMRYDKVNITLNTSTFTKLNNNDLISYLDNYINQKYNRDCSGTGCVIPFAITAFDSQAISFLNQEVKYRESGGALLSSSSFYSLESSNATITSPILSLDLEKSGITVPLISSDTKLRLYLNKKDILPNPLQLNITSGFSFDIYPKNVLVSISTVFNISSSESISSATWDFGDGSSGTSTGKSITHKYSSSGNYSIEVQATSTSGKTSKIKFPITVGDAKTSADLLIKRYESYINNVTSQIQTYPPWISSQISTKLNYTSLRSDFLKIKDKYSIASSDENYSQILQELINLNPPYSISPSETGALPFSVGFDNINTQFAESIASREIDALSDKQREDLKSKLINWNNDNFNSEVDYKVISISTDSGQEPLFSIFKIKLTKKNETNSAVNLLIDYPKNEIVFTTGYGERELNIGSTSGTAIPISNSQTIEFLVPGKVSLADLGMYLSPDITELNSLDSVSFIEPNTRPKKAVWFYMVLILAFFVIYLSLQEWYKKHYESYLFKNQDDLYNLINFMFNSRLSRLADGEIKMKLGAYNWTGEQITYAFKKLDVKIKVMF